MPSPHHSKNIVYGSITAGGNVHIGDNITYIVEQAFKQSILFLRIEDMKDGNHALHLSIKSKHGAATKLRTTGENLLHEAVKVNIPTQLFDDLKDFQAFRRGIDIVPTRLAGFQDLNPSSVIAFENHLAQQIFQTFFASDIGQVCADFIQLLEERRIEELLLAIATDDETIVNLPFEMVLPLLFPPKLGESKKSLAINNFGLVRTKVASLEAFKLQGDHATAAPLKMLFITALPENLDERGKMLQIEEEQTRLIQSIGALEATGDKKPKIVIEFLENASLEELDKALHDRKHDIVHISGHGAYQVAENKGVLYFENEDGDEAQISGAALGETLRQHACVKLLILSACETAIAGSEGGVTEQAVAYGVPGIVAMRFAVTDEGAKVFTTEFYTQLAQGLSLTRAVAYAREALHLDIARRRKQSPQIRHNAEWFTPVVYQNQSVGALIDKTQPYLLPDDFYPLSSFPKTKQSRLIGEGFIGRKRYLIQLRQAFRAGRHVCLHGLGGLGKTTLAEAFSHNYASHEKGEVVIFRNGHQINEKFILDELLARLEDENAPKSTIRHLKAQLDDPQTDVLEKLQSLIDNYLKGRKTILIFDNVEDVQKDEGGAYQRSIVSESLRAFLRHLCENTPHNCHILFTTRYKMEDLADVVEHLALDKMGYAEQYRLLNYAKTLRDIPLRDRDEVYKRLDGHPRGYEYLEALLKKDKTFTWQQVADSEEKVFENLLLAKVYERLTEREKAVFQIIAVFITRTPVVALAAVSGEEEEDLCPVLQSLQDWSLCFLEKEGRFEVHRLTREWMQENVIDGGKIKKWAYQIADYYKVNPNSFEDIKLCINYLEVSEAWEDFADISLRLENIYYSIGSNQKAFEINQVILEKNINNRFNGFAFHNLGNIAYIYGDLIEALDLYEKSLLITRHLNDFQSEAATLSKISEVHSSTGDYDTAIIYLKRSLMIYQKIRNDEGVCMIMNNIGLTYTKKGDYDSALRYFEQSLSIGKQIQNSKIEGATLGNISEIYTKKQNFDTALHYLKKSLTIQQQTRDSENESISLGKIGLIYFYKKDYDNALLHLKQSLDIIQMQEIINRPNQINLIINISTIVSEKGDYNTALHYLEQSRDIALEMGDKAGLAASLYNIGAIIWKQKNDAEQSMTYLLLSYQLDKELRSPKINDTEKYLGYILEQIGNEKFKEIALRVIKENPNIDFFFNESESTPNNKSIGYHLKSFFSNFIRRFKF